MRRVDDMQRLYKVPPSSSEVDLHVRVCAAATRRPSEGHGSFCQLTSPWTLTPVDPALLAGTMRQTENVVDMGSPQAG
jgi:hypothetical protein